MTPASRKRASAPPPALRSVSGDAVPESGAGRGRLVAVVDELGARRARGLMAGKSPDQRGPAADDRVLDFLRQR